MVNYVDILKNDNGEYILRRKAVPSDIDVYAADFAYKLDLFFSSVTDDIATAINSVKTELQTKTEFNTDIKIRSGIDDTEGFVINVRSDGYIELYGVNKFIGTLLFETLKVVNLTADNITTNSFKVPFGNKYLVFDSIDGLYFLDGATKQFVIDDEAIIFNSAINFNNNVYINGLMTINTDSDVKIGCMNIGQSIVEIDKPIITTGEIYVGSVSEENKLTTGENFLAKIKEVQDSINEQELNLKQFYDRFNIGNFQFFIDTYYTVFTDTFKTRSINVPVYLTGLSAINVDGFNSSTTASINISAYTCDDNGLIDGNIYAEKNNCVGQTTFTLTDVFTNSVLPSNKKVKRLEIEIQYTNAKGTTNCFVSIVKI